MLESPSPVFLEPLFLYRTFHSDQEHSPGLDSEIQHVYLDLNSGKPHQACQPLTDLRRELSREAQAGSRPKPGPWTHCSSWLSSRFTRLLTACLQLARPGPNSYPSHRANPGRAFCLPRRKKQNGTELAWSQKETSSVTMSLLLRDHKKPTFTQVAATTKLHLNSFMVLPPKI